jgi:hypothetical protein
LDIGSIRLYAGLSATVGKTQSFLEKKCNILPGKLLQGQRRIKNQCEKESLPAAPSHIYGNARLAGSRSERKKKVEEILLELFLRTFFHARHVTS